jgi:hypothetical protein
MTNTKAMSPVIVEAKYSKTGVDRYNGNPLIEALPAPPQCRAEFDSFVEHTPPKPDDTARQKSEVVRLMEAMTMKDLVYSFPEYSKACLAMATLMRESYVSRNPLNATDVQRRHALATRSSDGVLFPDDWKSSADGYFIIAITGMGKTTLMESFLVRHPQLIKHTSYQGKPVPCRYQIVYLYLRIPHNGTLTALCLQFFRKVDGLLGTNYTRQAKGVRSIAPMVELMNQVASAVSLSFIVVDELQNLRSARGENPDIALNYLSEIIEGLGISVICISTPGVHSVLQTKVRSIRKLSSAGSMVIQPMKKGDAQWKTFCELCWDYTYVKNKPRLDEATMNVWHDISAGNTAFAALVFLLTQQNEIGGREVVDMDALKRTASTDMAFLQPAIAALRSGKSERLRDFDDLIYGEKYRDLQRLLGVENGSDDVPDAEVEELEEIEQAVKNSVKSRQRRKKLQQQPEQGWSEDIAIRDPLEP